MNLRDIQKASWLLSAIFLIEGGVLMVAASAFPAGHRISWIWFALAILVLLKDRFRTNRRNDNTIWIILAALPVLVGIVLYLARSRDHISQLIG